MRFAHIADCHIGAWRDPKLKDINAEAFEKAIDLAVQKKVDFIILAGDLFNTSLPGIDGLKIAVIKLKQLRDLEIKVYAIAGSHDYSPSGKTMIDVLDQAGLLVNVVKGDIVDDKLKLKFTVDKKTGVKITGIFGRKGMLDRKHYEELVRENLEKEKGFKIFIFHTALSEFKPKELEKMDASPLSLLPKGFNYYAGGHVHIVGNFNSAGYDNVVFPGPTFPNNFRELEVLQNGGFYIYEGNVDSDGFVKNGKTEYVPVIVKNVFSLEINCNGKDVDKVIEELDAKIKREEFLDTIVTIRLVGKLVKGKPSDFNFNEIFKKFYNKGAYYVMKSTYNLRSAEFEEVKIDTASVDDAEDKIMREHLGQVKVSGWDKETELKMIKALMAILETEKHEGEKVVDFEKRVVKEVNETLKLGL
ncbi:MAG: DNA repair exonuclease [Nanoarchaeota archaeon]|nr:DNA repair exonuclease [Nanoarchaeota archaeon]